MEAQTFCGIWRGISIWSDGILLTDTEISQAQSCRFPDERWAWLFLWVTPTGAKLWRWKYRFNGAGKQMSYGQYPDVPLVNARERHDEARKLLAGGH